jgi:hypothetical protein
MPNNRPRHRNAKRSKRRHDVPRRSPSWATFGGRKVEVGPFTGTHFVLGCRDKRTYATREEARTVAKSMTRREGESLKEYRCLGGCGAWHVGHPALGVRLTRCKRRGCRHTCPERDMRAHLEWHRLFDAG